MNFPKRFSVALVALLLFLGPAVLLRAALTKSRTSLYSSQTLTAGAGDTTSAAQNTSTAYSTQIHMKITNGGTGPSVPAQCQITVAADTAGTLYVNFGGPLVSNTGNSVVTSWSVELPISIQSFKIACGSNTTQNVTLDADYVMTTGL